MPYALRKYVRREHVLTLEDAIRKFTSLPAAQMVVFDPEKVRDVATFENPNQLSQGCTTFW